MTTTIPTDHKIWILKAFVHTKEFNEYPLLSIREGTLDTKNAYCSILAVLLGNSLNPNANRGFTPNTLGEVIDQLRNEAKRLKKMVKTDRYTQVDESEYVELIARLSELNLNQIKGTLIFHILAHLLHVHIQIFNLENQDFTQFGDNTRFTIRLEINNGDFHIRNSKKSNEVEQYHTVSTFMPKLYVDSGSLAVDLSPSK